MRIAFLSAENRSRKFSFSVEQMANASRKRSMRKNRVKRLKIIDEKQRKSMMNFQHLPYEIYREIFDYLQPMNVIQAFHGLDYHLDRFIENIPMKLNFQNCNKMECRRILKQLVPRITKQIVTMDLGRVSFDSDILIDLFTQSFQWNEFPHLRCLSLTSPTLQQLESLISAIPSMSSLRSLRLVEQHYYGSQNETVCKLVLANHNYQSSEKIRLSIDTSPPFRNLRLLQKHFNNQISVDYLQINLRCSLFFYPDSLTNLDCEGLSQLIPNMDHLKIEVMCGTIEPIFDLIRRFPRIQYLSVWTVAQAYADGYQWTDLLSQFPNLINLHLRLNLDSSRSVDELKTFQTKFWSERQWFSHCQKSHCRCQIITGNVTVR